MRSKAEMVTPFLAARIHVKGLLRRADRTFMHAKNGERALSGQQQIATTSSRDGFA
jgi:hypothetical protein